MSGENLPAWLSAVTSVGALAAALFAGWAAWQITRIERVRDRRSQALSVSAWAAQRPEEPRPAAGAGAKKQVAAGVHLLNTSPTPVTDVFVDFSDHDGEPYPALHLRILPPGSYFVPQTRFDRFKWGYPEPATEAVVAIMKSETWRVSSLRFTDNSGVAWERSTSGTLREREAARHPYPAA